MKDCRSSDKLTAMIFAAVLVGYLMCSTARAKPSPRPDGCTVIYDPITQTCRPYCPPKPLVG